MAESKKEEKNPQSMELENEKKEVVVEQKAETYILDEDDDDFEEFEIDGFWKKLIKY